VLNKKKEVSPIDLIINQKYDKSIMECDKPLKSFLGDYKEILKNVQQIFPLVLLPNEKAITYEKELPVEQDIDFT
jgi:hypothetical protein